MKMLLGNHELMMLQSLYYPSDEATAPSPYLSRWYRNGGKVTHDQMYASLCAQYALGVDIFTYYYGERFMDPETYTKYNHALGRIANLMAGRTVADALLYYPIETMQMHHRPSDAQYGTYPEAENNC